jgi:ribose 5-phosphate isomerase B
MEFESSILVSQCPPVVVGIAADHGGFELKRFLAGKLRAAGCKLIDFGDRHLRADDDYPDYVVPLARAISRGDVPRGVALCGSGVGASIVANKVVGVRACLIHDTFSAHQGVEDDDLNLICLGGLVIGHALAWELVQTFLTARFSAADRHCRRLAKVAELEGKIAGSVALSRARASGSEKQDSADKDVGKSLPEGMSSTERPHQRGVDDGIDGSRFQTNGHHHPDVHQQTVREAKELWRYEGNPN